jgi:hypothetical protein
MILALMPAAAYAQTDDSNYKVDTLDNRVGVVDSLGREVVTFENDRTDGGVTMSVSGLKFFFAPNDRHNGDAQTPNVHKFVGIYDRGGVQNLEIGPPYKHGKHQKAYNGFLGTFELGFNEFTGTDYSMYPAGEKEFLDLYNAKSFYVSWNLIDVAIPFNKAHTFGMTFGLGITWRDYTFSDRITLTRDNDMLGWKPAPNADDSRYKKSKLNTFSLTVPLLFEVNHRGLFLAAGLYGDLTLGSHTKVKKPKSKEHGNFYVNMANVGVTARVGYKHLYLLCNYSLTPMFKENKGPKTNVLTVGFGIGF